MAKRYEDLEFTDGFMFAKIMYHCPDLCKELLELILQKPIYTFRYRSQEDPEQFLEDGTWTVFLNAAGDMEGLSPELKDFLHYIRTGNVNSHSSSLVTKLDQAVLSARQNTHWRTDYMTYEQEMKHQFYLGQQEGLEKGHAEERASMHKLLEEVASGSITIEEALRKTDAVPKE